MELLLEKWFIPKKIDIVENLRAVSTYAKRELDKRQRLAINFNRREKLTPVVKWGQSYTHALVSVTLGKKHDVRICSEVWGSQVEFQPNSLSLSALGILERKPVEYNLELPLAYEIVPEESSFQLENETSLVLKLKKKEEKQIWKNLTPVEFDEKRVDLKIWWELADIYKEAMKKYNRAVDTADLDLERVSRLCYCRKNGAREGLGNGGLMLRSR